MNRLEKSTYKTWCRVIHECSPNGRKGYFLKNIKVCDSWISYQNFLKDMGVKPGVDYHLIRIDKSKGFNPENVIWADKKTQIQLNNLKKISKSKFTGVYAIGSKWASRLIFNGKHFYLGCYSTIQEAVKARNEFIIKNGLPHEIQSRL